MIEVKDKTNSYQTPATAAEISSEKSIYFKYRSAINKAAMTTQIMQKVDL